MSYYEKNELLDKALELTRDVVSGSGEKAAFILANPKLATDFIQAVYDKLSEINETIE